MRKDLNELVTQIGPGTPCGQLMRQYWQPVALLDEFDATQDPAMGIRPVKAVRVLGQDLVLFRDAPQNGQPGVFGLLDRDCPHRGADLSFGRRESEAQGGGLRCPFHGWKFAPNGQCLETPAEPDLPSGRKQFFAGPPQEKLAPSGGSDPQSGGAWGRKFCDGIRQRSYPMIEKAGVLFAWLGPEHSTPPPFPDFDCFKAPSSHSFAFKGMWNCNWLQAVEVGIDPAHPSFLHVFFDDESLADTGDNKAGRQFRSGSAGEVNGERWPMSRIMREFNQPEIRVEPTDFGMRLTALRPMTDELTHVRVTNSIFPHTFVIPLSETMTITQIHLPVDDTHTYWYSIFTSFAGPLDHNAMRQQRLKSNPAPLFLPVSGRHNRWGFNADEQQTKTFLGMGDDDINVHDQWACESMGVIADRTREHLGASDKAIIANRRLLIQAIETVQAGGAAPGLANATLTPHMHGPDTVDGIAPADDWEGFWQRTAAAKRASTPWLNLPNVPHVPRMSDLPAKQDSADLPLDSRNDRLKSTTP